MLSLNKFCRKEFHITYDIDFYKTAKGSSPIEEFLDELRQKTDKNSRIQYEQAVRYIRLLSQNGAALLPRTIAKPVQGEIWELRPGSNRIFFFYYNKGTYVLLHHYVKKSQKTPRGEIERANAEMLDHIRQKVSR